MEQILKFNNLIAQVKKLILIENRENMYNFVSPLSIQDLVTRHEIAIDVFFTKITVEKIMKTISNRDYNAKPK